MALMLGAEKVLHSLQAVSPMEFDDQVPSSQLV
jgi:hypothetical protein